MKYIITYKKNQSHIQNQQRREEQYILTNYKPNTPEMTVSSLWTTENVKIGQLLRAVADMQSFIHVNWTSALTRHRDMPTSEDHWTRSQMRRSSILAVRARPTPDVQESDGSEAAIDICIRRKKLSEAWEVMQESDTDVWIEACNLYAKIVDAEQHPEKYADDKALLEEITEAKNLMRNAEILAAVGIIKKYDQEEWKDVHCTAYGATPWAKKQIRRGSLTTVHEHHHEESTIESRVRHAEHASAWDLMAKCDKVLWQEACHYHEEMNEVAMLKERELEEAVEVIQEFNSRNWTGAHLRHKGLPTNKPHWTSTQIHHGSTLAVHSFPTPELENEVPAHKLHHEKLTKAWEVMREVGQTEWTKACKAHENEYCHDPQDMPVKSGNAFKTGGVIRIKPPVRNCVNGNAA
ncbi:hypothetical protein ACHAXS_005865 [Conticribra weissflogii]